MFLYGQYEDLTPQIIEREVEKIVYVGGQHGGQSSTHKIPIIRVKLLRKEDEKFNIIVKSIEEF